MCGIIGQLAFGELNEDKERIRRESMIFLGSELLQLTTERGEDATGVSLMFEDGNYMGLKMGIAPIEFIARFGKTEKEYGGFIKYWRKSKRPVKSFLGHCRKKSRGSEKDNNNNHPIRVGDIIGIHNGTLDNDDKIFKNLNCDRSGDVDSEAIFRLLHHFSNNGKEPFSVDMMEEVISRLDGKFSVLGTSGNNPYQVCSFRDGRPMELALITPLNLLLIASEKKFINMAIFRYNKYINLYIQDTKFPTIKKGDVEHKTLMDDSAGIFDLRKEIKPDTTIDDLMDWKKITRTKIESYKSEVRAGFYNSTNYGIRSNPIHHVGSGVSYNKSTPNRKASTHTNSPSSNNKCKTKGRIWSKKANRYVTSFTDDDIEETKSKGNIEIDVDRGEVEDVVAKDSKKKNKKDGKQDRFALEVGKGADESCTTSTVGVKEISGPGNPVSDTKTIEVDVTVDAEAVEKAEECVNMEPIFESEEEVINALDMPDVETLKILPIFSLANRMKKFIMKMGFVKGYSTRKAEEEKIEETSYIRTLKSVLEVYKRLIYYAGHSENEAAIERMLVSSMEEGSDINKDVLDKLFSPGDEKKDKIICYIKKLVTDKDSKTKQVTK